MRSIFICFVFLLYNVNAYKVLLMFPFPVRSLSILSEGFLKNLIDAGHEVTYVTSVPTKRDYGNNFRQIDVSKNFEVLGGDSMLNINMVMTGGVKMNDVSDLQEFAIMVAEKTFKSHTLMKLLEDETERFDVVVADLYEVEAYAGLSVLYNCPMIWSYSMGAHWQPLRLIDERTNPAYTSDYLSPNMPPLTFQQRLHELWGQVKGCWAKWYSMGAHWQLLRLIDERTNPAYTSDYLSPNMPPLTFQQRLHELWGQVKGGWEKWYNLQPKEEKLYTDIFKPLVAKRGRALPDYKEVLYNASLVFANEHHAFGTVPSVPLNFKPIGGFHIDSPAKPLPQDLQALMDKSTNGVIYFSMGSTWKSKDIPKNVTEGLLKMFSELKQTVIWKYEADLLNVPKNVHLVKWAPQPSILAHPNCHVFISHGGLLSSTEALHFGVATIGVPIFFDQFVNINKAVGKGYAIQVPLTFNLAEDLKVAIRTMVNDPRYRLQAKKLSSIYHDRPVSPAKEVVHWIEHVIKTGGAPHLRSPSVYVQWYQKTYLDFGVLVFGVVILLLFVVKTLITKSSPKVKKSGGKKEKSN